MNNQELILVRPNQKTDKREKELREWQKVVIYKIFRQNELNSLNFNRILEKYRNEAQAFIGIDLKKQEISEDALRRVLLELVSSKILNIEPSDSFRLTLISPKTDQFELIQRVNSELANMIGPNPFVYTIDEVAKEIAPKVGMEIPLIRNSLRQSIEMDFLEVDDKDRLAFPR